MTFLILTEKQVRVLTSFFSNGYIEALVNAEKVKMIGLVSLSILLSDRAPFLLKFM